MWEQADAGAGENETHFYQTPSLFFCLQKHSFNTKWTHLAFTSLCTLWLSTPCSQTPQCGLNLKPQPFGGHKEIAKVTVNTFPLVLTLHMKDEWLWKDNISVFPIQCFHHMKMRFEIFHPNQTRNMLHRWQRSMFSFAFVSMFSPCCMDTHRSILTTGNKEVSLWNQVQWSILDTEDPGRAFGLLLFRNLLSSFTPSKTYSLNPFNRKSLNFL